MAKKNVYFQMSLFVVTILFIFALQISATPVRAASPYVSGLRVQQADTGQIRLCWKTDSSASFLVANVQPVIVYRVVGSDSQITVDPHNYRLGCATVASKTGAHILSENTSYIFNIVYQGSAFSGYSDYVPSQGKVVSEDFVARTAKDRLSFTAVDKTFVFPNDRVRLYGKNIGTAPNELDSIKAYLGPMVYTTASLSGNFYQLTVTDWNSQYIEFKVPAYDANKLQFGKIYLPDNLVTVEGSYPAELKVKVLSSYSDLSRTISSYYQDSYYQYLINASTFRYNTARTSHSNGQEGERNIWISRYLKGLGRGVDALWSINLSYAMVYGGYTEDEVKHEIRFGPGCVHVNIKQEIWRTTSDYAKCMSHSL